MWREAAEWWQNYEGQSPLEYCIDDAIIEMHQSLQQRRWSMTFKKRVCLEWRDKITPHIVSRSASAHYRRSIKQWHHCSSSGVEDKRDPIRKTCDSINISYRNDPEQVFPWKSFLCNILQISSINHTKPPIPRRYPHQRTSWVTVITIYPSSCLRSGALFWWSHCSRCSALSTKVTVQLIMITMPILVILMALHCTRKAVPCCVPWSGWDAEKFTVFLRVKMKVADSL